MMDQGLCTSPEQYARLVNFIQTKLPPELRHEIQGWVFQKVFCPGRVYHDREARLTYAKDEADRNPRFDLLRVSKSVRQLYEPRIWSENTFVVGAVRYYTEAEPLWPIPSNTSRLIQKVYLGFSIRDLGNHLLEFWPEHIIDKYKAKIDEDAADARKGTHVPYRIDEFVCDPPLRDFRGISTKALIRLWAEKIFSIRSLGLRELTLDFLECYGFHAQYLGLCVAHHCRRELKRISASLKIVAPDEEKKAELTHELRLITKA